MVKAVIFDFGQTIADSSAGFREAEKTAQTSLFTYLQTTSFDDFLMDYRRLRIFFQKMSEFSRKRLWVGICEYYDIKPDEALFNQWETRYWDTVEARTQLFPEAIHTLEKLAANYRLALITNTRGQKSSAGHRFHRFQGLKKLFRVVIVAGEEGIPAKPDPVPFRLCLEQLGISPPEAVYVGDDWRIDIGGARNVGIHPIWIRHHSVERSWPEADESVPVITSLEDLLNIEDILKDTIAPGGSN